MTENGPVTCWIEQVKAGRQTAAAEIWNLFYARLIGMARRKLRDAPRRAADEEDVVVNAFDTFFRRATEGQFPDLHDRHDLWQLLVKITERKAVSQLRHHGRVKRGGGEVRGESVFADAHGSTSGAGVDQVRGAEPTPQFAAELAEDLQRLLGLLEDEELVQIALLKLEGCTNAEIADRVDRSLPTVERRLRLIRSTWQREIPEHRATGETR
jgi:DNA-directed RNA polymerase specialized sigma24 family protein